MGRAQANHAETALFVAAKPIRCTWKDDKLLEKNGECYRMETKLREFYSTRATFPRMETNEERVTNIGQVNTSAEGSLDILQSEQSSCNNYIK